MAIVWMLLIVLVFGFIAKWAIEKALDQTSNYEIEKKPKKILIKYKDIWLVTTTIGGEQ